MEAWLCSVERKRDFNLRIKGGMSSEEKGGSLGQGSGVGRDLRGDGEKAPGMKPESLVPYPGLSSSWLYELG